MGIDNYDNVLARRGLLREKAYVSVFWDEVQGYTAKVVLDEGEAKGHRGYGDLAASTEVICVRPKL